MTVPIQFSPTTGQAFSIEEATRRIQNGSWPPAFTSIGGFKPEISVGPNITGIVAEVTQSASVLTGSSTVINDQFGETVGSQRMNRCTFSKINDDTVVHDWAFRMNNSTTSGCGMGLVWGRVNEANQIEFTHAVANTSSFVDCAAAVTGSNHFIDGYTDEGTQFYTRRFQTMAFSTTPANGFFTLNYGEAPPSSPHFATLSSTDTTAGNAWCRWNDSSMLHIGGTSAATNPVKITSPAGGSVAGLSPTGWGTQSVACLALRLEDHKALVAFRDSSSFPRITAITGTANSLVQRTSLSLASSSMALREAWRLNNNKAIFLAGNTGTTNALGGVRWFDPSTNPSIVTTGFTTADPARTAYGSFYMNIGICPLAGDRFLMAGAGFVRVMSFPDTGNITTVNEQSFPTRNYVGAVKLPDQNAGVLFYNENNHLRMQPFTFNPATDVVTLGNAQVVAGNHWLIGKPYTLRGGNYVAFLPTDRVIRIMKV